MERIPTCRRAPLRAAIGATLLVAAATPASAQLAFALPEFSAWGPDRVLLDAPALDGAGAGCPIESPDGLTLYTARRDATGEFASLDLWVNERTSIDEPFAPGVRLPEPVNTVGAPEFCPTPLADGSLMFVSGRPGGAGDSVDIYVARNHPVLGWQEPERLGSDPFGPNTPGLEQSPSLIPGWRGVFLFYSTDFFSGNQDLYGTRLGPFEFSEGVPLETLNTPFDDRQPNVSRDGLEIVFASDRHAPGSGDFDIYYARRDGLLLPFSEPINLSRTVPFSTAAQSETRPSFSRDGERLVWGSAGVIHESARSPQACLPFALRPRCDD